MRTPALSATTRTARKASPSGSSIRLAALVCCALAALVCWPAMAGTDAFMLRHHKAYSDAVTASSFPFKQSMSDIGIRQLLDEEQLHAVKGRFVPDRHLEFDEPLGIILWDESRGARSGAPGVGSQQHKGGSNEQRQSLSTTTVR